MSSFNVTKESMIRIRCYAHLAYRFKRYKRARSHKSLSDSLEELLDLGEKVFNVQE